MIIKRRLYSEEDNSKAERTGEAIGTAALGVGGSLVAGKYAGKIAKNAAIGKESERAAKNYRAGLKKLANERAVSEKTAADKLAGYKEGISKKWFGKKKATRKAEEAYNNFISSNKAYYKKAAQKLRKDIVSNKNKAIQKAGKRGKIGTIATGLGLTAIYTGSKLRKKKDNNGYDPKPGEIIR